MAVGSSFLPLISGCCRDLEQAGNRAAYKWFFLWHCFHSTQVPLDQALLICREHTICLCLCSPQPDTNL